jgi:hypothetical protein
MLQLSDSGISFSVPKYRAEGGLNSEPPGLHAPSLHGDAQPPARNAAAIASQLRCRMESSCLIAGQSKRLPRRSICPQSVQPHGRLAIDGSDCYECTGDRPKPTFDSLDDNDVSGGDQRNGRASALRSGIGVDWI